MSKFKFNLIWIVILGLLAFVVTHFSSKQSTLFIGNEIETKVDTIVLEKVDTFGVYETTGAYYKLDSVLGESQGSLLTYCFSICEGFEGLGLPIERKVLDIPGQYTIGDNYFLQRTVIDHIIHD